MSGKPSLSSSSSTSTSQVRHAPSKSSKISSSTKASSAQSVSIPVISFEALARRAELAGYASGHTYKANDSVPVTVPSSSTTSALNSVGPVAASARQNASHPVQRSLQQNALER